MEKRTLHDLKTCSEPWSRLQIAPAPNSSVPRSASIKVVVILSHAFPLPAMESSPQSSSQLARALAPQLMLHCALRKHASCIQPGEASALKQSA
jgi:hypothetical protein